MSRPLSPPPYFNSSIQHHSICTLQKRTYPLNFKSPLRKPSPKKPSPDQFLPEFLQEYVKNPPLPSKIKAHSIISHIRSKSDQYSLIPAQKQPCQRSQKSTNPVISYKNFKEVHKTSRKQSKVTIPKIFKVSNTNKLMKKYLKFDSNFKYGAIETEKNLKKETTPDDIDLKNVFEPGLSYGEKLMKLKALVASNLL